MTLQEILALLSLAFRKDRVNLTHWAQALMTTGAAVIATALFTKEPVAGIVGGLLALVVSAIFNAKAKERR